MKEEKCRRCVYRARPGAGYQCDYATVTGHTRRAVPPAKCRKFREGKRIAIPKEEMTEIKEPQKKEKRRGGGSAPRIDWDRGRELYGQGKSDVQIGEALKCDRHTVYLWRKTQGMPPNVGARGKSVLELKGH